MMKTHPAAELFPLMSESELDDLITDIQANGQQFPIIALDGQILDGRNRWLACEHLGVTPKVEQYEGDDPVTFVISANLKRRHLTQTQKAEIALKAIPLFAQAAKERQRLAGMQYGENHPKSDEELSTSMGQPLRGHGKAVVQAARAADVSPSYVETAKRIANQAPDLHKRVLAGEFSLAIAEKKLRQRLAKQGKEPVIRRKPKQNRYVLQGAKSEAAIAQLDAEAERQTRAAVAYDVIERLGRCPYEPTDVAAAIPTLQRFRVDEHLKAACEWLEEFRRIWKDNDDPA
jgi:ParB-like chromosome segregation protein Spo0J